jgi:glucan phosphoethanolaminetransferase (alkaline phosphatase superfamily)
MLIDWLSNAYIGHPLVQAIVSDVGKVFGVCFLLIWIWGCLFLGFFARNCRYIFPPRSLSGKCWRAAWLLQIVVMLICACHFYKNEHDPSLVEIVLFFSPYVLMIISFVLAGRYHQKTGKALQEKAERENHGKHSISG